MNGDSVGALLDSVIVIDHLNGIAAAERYLRSVRDGHVSVITRAEVLAGTSDSDLLSVRQLLDRFPTLPIDRAVADLAANLRRKHRWSLPDALQAALAQIHQLQLATRNTNDFPPARHSWVHVPYRFS